MLEPLAMAGMARAHPATAVDDPTLAAWVGQMQLGAYASEPVFVCLP
jgi:hypothetical protein